MVEYFWYARKQKTPPGEPRNAGVPGKAKCGAFARLDQTEFGGIERRFYKYLVNN
jgi:hypothetical protein